MEGIIVQDVVKVVVKVGISPCLFGHDLGSWFRGTIVPDTSENVSEDKGRSLVLVRRRHAAAECGLNAHDAKENWSSGCIYIHLVYVWIV